LRNRCLSRTKAVDDIHHDYCLSLNNIGKLIISVFIYASVSLLSLTYLIGYLSRIQHSAHATLVLYG
jgi:hypothetical protein